MTQAASEAEVGACDVDLLWDQMERRAVKQLIQRVSQYKFVRGMSTECVYIAFRQLCNNWLYIKLVYEHASNKH